MPKEADVCHFLFLCVQVMQSLYRAHSMAQIFFLLDISASAPVILGLLVHLDFRLPGIAGDLAVPCQCLAHFFTIRGRIILKLDNQISNQRIEEESFPFIFPFHATGVGHSPNKSHRYKISQFFVDKSPRDD